LLYQKIDLAQNFKPSYPSRLKAERLSFVLTPTGIDGDWIPLLLHRTFGLMDGRCWL
jgi:hypothetical protein